MHNKVVKTMDLSKKLFINSQVELATMNDDVLVKTPFKIYKLSGENVKSELIPALPYLDKGISLQKLIKHLPINDIESFLNAVITPMVNRKWLSFEERSSTDPKLLNKNAFISLGSDGEQLQHYLQTKKVAVIGLSKFANDLVKNLHRYISNVCLFLPSNRQLGQASNYYEYNLENLDELFESLVKYDLVILTESKENSHFEKQINRIAISHGVRVMYSSTNGFNITIGPTVIPHKTGCLECLQFRKLNNNSFSKEFMAFNKGTSYGTAPYDGASVDVNTKDMMSNMITLEAIRLFMLDKNLYKSKITLEMPETLNAIVEFNSFTNTLSTNSFLKNPRCVACGEDLYLNPEIKPWMEDYTYPVKGGA